MEGFKLYILGFPGEFRGNHWKREVEESAIALGWDVVHRAAQGADPDDVVREAKECDLFLWLRTHRNDPRGSARAMLRRIEDAGVPTVGMHMDLYWSIPQREPLIDPLNNPWFSCQRVYTADGGHQAEFAQRGINHFWMPPGMGDRWLGLAGDEAKRSRFKKEIVFVGSNSRGIHGDHRGMLLDWARRRYAAKFAHYGVHNKVHGKDLSHVYAVAKVVLGDSAPADRYWSDRIPTTMGRGGVLAYPNTPGLEEQGYDGSNMLLYDRYDFQQLGDQIMWMGPNELALRREAAITVTEERHMWRHRLLQIRNEALG